MPAAEIERLRALLADAVLAAEQAGDDSRTEQEGVGYLAQAREGGVERAIEEIASYEGEITMFVGAGVSMEAELPSWEELVRRLLVKTRRGEDDVPVEAWADSVLRDGPLAAAAVAEAHYENGAFRRALREALYEREPGAYAPGALAGQIAWLKERLKDRLALLTVNYDGLLEGALAERGLACKSYVRGWREPPGTAAVWHLHGRLARNSRDTDWLSDGNLILSEGSYVRSTAATFPQQFVAERLQSSLCVFVGLSMTDPNFIRWLYNSAQQASRPRFVIFVRQASPTTDPRVRRALEQSAAARWRRYGVTPVWANYYGEVAQIVHEIGLRCDGGEHVEFSERARRRLSCARERLSPSDRRAFVEAQIDASMWLRGRLYDVAAICEAVKLDLSGHRLGLGLWAVDHERGEVLNWASSDRAYQEPDSAVPVPLHADSRWLAARAIASGVSVQQDPRVYASRWRFIRAVPIAVQPEGERSLVGAITLTSTTPLEQFPLARALAPVGLLNEIDAFLVERAGRFFEP